jgi:uncharacterized protein (TIGR03067 family)
MRSTAVLFACCGLCIAAKPMNKELTMKDEEAIQGVWILVSGERHAKAFSDDVVNAVSLELSADVLSTKNRDHVSKAKFKLHPNATPKGIDLDMDGSIGRGIYSLDGDNLTILHGEVGDERPTDFDPRTTPRLTLLVLKRGKPNESEPRR